MAELPSRAGLAILEYSAEATTPHREGNVIIIPASKHCPKCSKVLLGKGQFCPDCGAKVEEITGHCPSCGVVKTPGEEFEILPLKPNFEQFVLLKRPKDGNWWRRNEDGSELPQVWFGGTDEAPFLVQMSNEVHNVVEDPEEFYGELIPPIMLILARKWGGHFRRQGDIFAFPLPHSWDQIKEVVNFTKANGFQFKETKEERVFNTRHILRGRWVKIMVAGQSSVIAEGTITAPDHAPIELKGPHVLDQTRHLFNPAQAD